MTWARPTSLLAKSRGAKSDRSQNDGDGTDEGRRERVAPVLARRRVAPRSRARGFGVDPRVRARARGAVRSPGQTSDYGAQGTCEERRQKTGCKAFCRRG